MAMIKSAWIWLCRFRKRKGYGVHSPFAFQLITQVINQRTPYYAIVDLHKERRMVEKGRLTHTEKYDKFVFRLVNDSKPDYVIAVDACADSFTMQYMQKAKPSAMFLHTTNMKDAERAIAGLRHERVFVQISNNIGDIWSLVNMVVDVARQDYVLVIDDIHASKQNATKWRELKENKKVGITFDLYNCGIVYFNHHLNKQHYIVNF